MIDRFEAIVRKMRRLVSRSEWAVQLLRFPRPEKKLDEPGLVMIQIDGLSRRQLEAALRKGRMPFLKHLLDREKYRLHDLYSGMPSSTPAVQGELFYGVKTAVPAFGFYHHGAGRLFRMFEAADAQTIENALDERGEPLLEGGSAYSDIYTGGAEEAHYCMPDMALGGLFHKSRPFSTLFVMLLNGYSLVRTLALLVIEFGLAIYDCIRGIISGQDLLKELKFVPTRVGICVLLRELVAVGAKMDVTRGLPVVHLNLLGYDEQSHRRGPSSAFAHWGLGGIDDAIKRIWVAARRSIYRDYDVWIYADHGQERTDSYITRYQKTVQQAVAEAYMNTSVRFPHDHKERRGIQAQRIRLMRQDLPRHLRHPDEVEKGEHPEAAPMVSAVGPLGHVYLPEKLEPEALHAFARSLVQEANIPLVLCAENGGKARAWNRHGAFMLPEHAAGVLGKTHPYLDEVARDLVALCHHEDAGALVISGWQYDRRPLSFPVENGAHAGPGREETAAFALLPKDAPLPNTAKPYLRPGDLREAARVQLVRCPTEEVVPEVHTALVPQTLRVMTYNVHSCIGMEGRVSPRRIARLIAQFDPDVVALQELDMNRERTHGHDQAQLLANYLRMDHHFHPVLGMEEEKYGDAILSRFPMRLVQAGPLPGLPHKPGLEPRGALWVRIEVNGKSLSFVNTHLGLRRSERWAQIQALLGKQWIGGLDPDEPIILCGDFNAFPSSAVCRAIEPHLVDAQRALFGHRPKKTWSGRYSLFRIDHIYVSRQFEVLDVQVADTELSRVASDHRPLLAELKLLD